MHFSTFGGRFVTFQSTTCTSFPDDTCVSSCLRIIVFVVETFVAKLAPKLVNALVLCFVVRKPTLIFKWFSTEAAVQSFMTFHVVIVHFFIGESGLAHIAHEWKVFIWNSRFHSLATVR